MTDDELRDLQERSALIEEMAAKPGWTMLLDRARVELYKRQQRLVRGRAEDFEDYKSECAWMDGVFWLMELPDRVNAELLVELELREVKKESDA